MKKALVCLAASILLLFAFVFSACGGNTSGTYYPSNEEIKVNLENNGYFVEAYCDDYIFDKANGDTDRYSAETVRARKEDGNYLHFCRINKSEACDYYYNELRKEYPDSEVFVLIENDEQFGNIVYCGTSTAIKDAGIQVVKVEVKV